MKTRTLFLLIILTNCSIVFAQSGYYGRKTMLEINALGRLPFIYNNLSGHSTYPYYKNVNGSLKKTENRLDLGFSGGLTFISKRNVSFAINGGLYYTETKALYAGGSHYIRIDDEQQVSVGSVESFRLRTINIQPTLVFSKERFTKPAGLSQEVGFGFQLSGLAPRDYLVVAEETEEQALVTANKNLVFNKDALLTALGFSYTLKIRRPVSDRLMLSYGLRYNLTIGNFKDHHINRFNGYYIQDIKSALNQQYLNLFVGVSLML